MSPRLVPRGPGCAARASATPGCAARASDPAAAVAPVSPFSHACVAMLAHGRDTSCWRDRAGRNKTEPLRRQAKQSTPELCGKTRTKTQRGTASNEMERSRIPLPTPAGSVKTVDRAEAESLGQVSGMRGALWTKMFYQRPRRCMQPPRLVHPGSPQPSVREGEREVMVGRVLGVAGSPAGGAGRRTGWGRVGNSIKTASGTQLIDGTLAGAAPSLSS
jgi:hypothetical protein